MTHGGLKVFCLFLLLLFFFLVTLRELLLDLDGGLVDKDSDCWLTLPCLLTPGDFKEVMLCKFLKNFILTNHATIKQSTIWNSIIWLVWRVRTLWVHNLEKMLIRCLIIFLWDKWVVADDFKQAERFPRCPQILSSADRVVGILSKNFLVYLFEEFLWQADAWVLTDVQTRFNESAFDFWTQKHLVLLPEYYYIFSFRVSCDDKLVREQVDLTVKWANCFDQQAYSDCAHYLKYGPN